MKESFASNLLYSGFLISTCNFLITNYLLFFEIIIYLIFVF